MNSVRIELHGKAFSLKMRLSQTLGASDHIDIKNISKNKIKYLPRTLNPTSTSDKASIHSISIGNDTRYFILEIVESNKS